MLKDIIRGVLGKEDKPEWMRPGAMVARISAISKLEFGKVVSSEDGGFYNDEVTVEMDGTGNIVQVDLPKGMRYSVLYGDKYIFGEEELETYVEGRKAHNRKVLEAAESRVEELNSLKESIATGDVEAMVRFLVKERLSEIENGAVQTLSNARYEMDGWNRIGEELEMRKNGMRR